MARQFLLLVLFCMVGYVCAGDPFKSNSIGTKDEFLSVKEAYRPSVDATGETLQLHWDIDEGYYLYRHQFAFKTSAGAEIAAQIPPGKGKEDEFFGHVEVYYHALDIALTPPADTNTFTLEVTAQGCAEAGLCYPPTTWYWAIDTAAKTATPIDAPPTATANNAAPSTTSPIANMPITTAAPQDRSWLAMLLFAILGGSILNLMPCVFPVLSLKVLAFASHKEEHLAVHGLVYTAGVVLSFLLVAIVLLALKAAGQAIGWGFQLQQPWFVAALAYLFFAMGLSLSGFWQLGGSWMGLGNDLAGRAGYSGSFFTGMLATLVASPCTAPFMAPALGFAATQPPVRALGIFAALGVGMALPILILCLSPKLLSRIPRPGAWMDYFKQALAFPLYATAIWLCWVAGQQTGPTGMMAVLSGMLAITLALWLWSFGQKRLGWLWRTAALIGLAVALSILGSPLLKVLDKASSEAHANTNWEPYSKERLANLRANGDAVFVNATAAWCITCLTNEKVTLSKQEVKDAFARHKVTYLKADWTHYDADITALLAQFGRNGVPLYIFFPKGKDSQPIVLPQLLRPSAILDTLDAHASP
ncbi:MAG: protein-disulfide reductase DsbD [Spongiibacteraceae bacterium]